MVKILVTGSDGRFGKVLKKTNFKNIIFRNKRELNILSTKSISKNLKKYKPKYLLHLAGLSRPMSIHDKDINKSIDLNIIGTSNIVKEASKLKVKVIIRKMTHLNHGIIIHGQNLEENAQFKCIRIP